MKNIITLLKLNKLISYFITCLLFTSVSFADTLAYDNFEYDKNGWTASWHSRYWEEIGIARDTTASKTYTFGPDYANQVATIRFVVWVPGAWENRGPNEDFFNILVNGSIVQTYKYTFEDSYTETFTTTLGTNGEITLAFNPDTTANEEYATIEYVRIDATKKTARVNEGQRDFTLRFQSALPGDIVTIGNTILVAPTTQTTNICNTYIKGDYIDNATSTNAQLQLCEYHEDTTQIFGTTKAKLTLPAGQTEIVWAGLYWQSLAVHPSNPQNMKIKIKHEDDTAYTAIDFDQVDWGNGVGKSGYDSYSAFKDITKLFKDNNWKSGDFTVGDIPTTEGMLSGLGAYGAWALVVIYKNDTKSVKQFNIYDGWKMIDNGNQIETITIDGFRTPRSAPIQASASMFVAEGDKRIKGDTLNAKPSKKSNFTKLSTFSSFVNTTPTFARTPSPTNNQGIDIHSFNLGTTGKNIIEPDETEIEFRFTSVQDKSFLPGIAQDRYWPSMISFSAELLVPDICYDYNIRKDKVSLRSEDRNINTSSQGELAINVSIRSMEGDFDLELSKLKLRLTPHDGTEFTAAKYSPNTLNTMIPAVHSASSTVQSPEIGIGSGVGTGVTTNGGTISRFERYFSEFKYNLTKDVYSGHFEIDLNTSIDFGKGPVNFPFSTENGTLPRCEQSLIYRPTWAQFNIERLDSKRFNTISQKDQRFPLYTQVAGRTFQFSMVSYDGNTKPSFHKEQPISGMTVDVELIDASPFDDNTSFFKCTNPDQSIIQTFPGGRRNFFVQFPSDKNISRVDLTGANSINISTNTALRNAAFRMWILVDSNNTIIKHTCAIDDNNCFKKLYKDSFKNVIDTKDVCKTQCQQGNSGCYTCLRDNFATPICSRDNFSIKPASYRIKISDNNESNDSTSPENSLGINDIATTVATVAAGYKYKIDANATLFGKDTFARGYGRDFVVPSNTDIIAQLQFNSASGASCADKNTSDLGLRFENGQLGGTLNDAGTALQQHSLQSHSNVGIYDLHIEDQNWTIVDQKRYVSASGAPIKTFPTVDDCIPNDSTISINGDTISGCSISSKLPTGSPGQTYEDLQLLFNPYKFDLNGTTLNMNPNNAAGYLFMNDFNSTFYTDDYRLHPLTMSALFSGSILSLSKDNKITTNFTNGCVAQDVVLSVRRITNPRENILLDSKGNLVLFQQALYDNNKTTVAPTNSVSGDKNVTLPKKGFEDTLEGKSNIRLHTTFQKPINATINPIDVNYTNLLGYSPNAASSAGMTTHIPDGNNTYNSAVIYYFAKVTPYKKVYANIIEETVRTPIFVDIYCDHLDGSCADNYNLTLPSKGQNVDIGWNAATMFNALEDGTADLAPSKGRITPNNPVAFSDGNGTRNDINVSAVGLDRPVSIDTTICPDPWLRFDLSDPNGCPHYKTNFIGGAGWSGVGDVGRASGAESNRNPGPSRLSW